MMMDIAKPVLLCSEWFIDWLKRCQLLSTVFSAVCEGSDIKFPEETKIRE